MAESTSSKSSSFSLTSILGGGANLINGLIGNIFGAKARQKELELKEQEQKYRQSLSTLDNQQKYVLQQQLNAAKTETERLQILENAVTQIKIAKINAASTNQSKTTYLVLGSAVVLIGLLLVIKKTDN